MSDAHTPDVSILIPVCNTARTLTRAVESLIRQSWQNIEIVIINDASPDNASEVIAELCRRDQRIIPVTLERNMGTFAARTAGLRRSRGRFIMNLDADDTLDPDAVQTLLAAAAKHGADAVGFGAREVTAEGKRLPYGNTLDSTPFILCGNDIFDALFCAHAFSWSLCLKMIDRQLMLEALESSGISPDMYAVFADDFLQFVPVAGKLKKFVMTGRIFYNYYQDIGITGKRQMDRAAFARAGSMLDVLREIKKFLISTGSFEQYRNAFAIREREQLQMLADRYHTRLPEAERQAVLADLCARYDDPELIRELFCAPPRQLSADRDSVRHLFKTESRIWYFLKKIQGKLKFRKGRVFHEC